MINLCTPDPGPDVRGIAKDLQKTLPSEAIFKSGVKLRVELSRFALSNAGLG